MAVLFIIPVLEMRTLMPHRVNLAQGAREAIPDLTIRKPISFQSHHAHLEGVISACPTLLQGAGSQGPLMSELTC